MLLKAGGRELVMLTKYDGASCLYVSAQDGHLEVVNALLEVGGRDLVMLTMDGGSSCLRISAANGHLEVVNALLKAGGRELVMASGGGERAAGGRGARACNDDQEHWSQLPHDQCAERASGGGERAGGRELVMLIKDNGASC